MSAPYRSYVLSGTALATMPDGEVKRVQFNSGIIRAGAKLREMLEMLIQSLLQQTGAVRVSLYSRNSTIEIRHLWIEESEIRKIVPIVQVIRPIQADFDLMEYEFRGEPHVIYR